MGVILGSGKNPTHQQPSHVHHFYCSCIVRRPKGQAARLEKLYSECVLKISLEQMEQDKEAWMVKAVRNHVSFLSQVMTFFILSFTLFRSVKFRAKLKS